MSNGFNPWASQAAAARNTMTIEANAYADQLRDAIADPNTPADVRVQLQAELRAFQGEMDSVRTDMSGHGLMEYERVTDDIRVRMDDLLGDMAEQWLGEPGADPLSLAAERISSSESTLRVMVPLSEMSGSELSSLLHSNPDAFARAWREMDPEDRQLAMFTLQQHASTEAQLTTLMTNLSQSAHQAAMAVARNLSA